MSPQGAGSPSQTYQRLWDTTESFLATLDLDSNTNGIAKSRFQAHLVDDYTHSWGQSYLKSLRPSMGQTLSAQGYLEHLAPMLANIRTREAKIQDIFIDEMRRVAIAKVSYSITPNGNELPVEHEAVWFCWLTPDGKRILRSEEYVDGATMTSSPPARP